MAGIHDPKYALPPVPPAPFGLNPFRVRGRALLEALGHAEEVMKGRAVETTEKLGPPGLAAFLRQPFSTTGWYDVYAVPYLMMVVARVRGIPYSQQMRENARVHAQEAHKGFSGILLKALSHEQVGVWVPRVSAYFHDFGRVETRVIAPRSVRGVRTGVPQGWVLGWGIVGAEFTEEVLRRAGAVNARVHTLEPERDGEVGGFATYSVPFEVRW